MSKRLKAPRYRKLIAVLEAIMVDPRETAKSRKAAAFRLDDLYTRLDEADERAAAHRRKVEIARIEAQSPSVAVSPELEMSDEERRQAEIATVFESVMPGGAK